jgi:protease-4
MSKRRSWILGVGCLVLLVGAGLILVALNAAMTPGLPKQFVLGIKLDRPIVEVAAEDPFAELTGGKPISLRNLRDALVRAADDERVMGVRLRVDSYGGGLAAAQEIRSLIARVQAAGKWTAAYMDTAGEGTPGNLEYYVAAACDEISLNPLGDINLIGLSARSPFIRGSFDKLGIQPEFRGRGDYKSARFMYTKTDFTPAHREMMEWLLDSIMDQLVTGIASNRGLEADAVRNLIDQAPFLGQEAVDVKLVDHIESWGELNDRLEEKLGSELRVIGPNTYLTRMKAAQKGPKIAVVTAIGGIMRGKSRKSYNPVLGGDIMGSETISKAWQDVRELDGVKAAIFRVDSPGGSAVASEVIRQEMIRTAAEIPIVVSMSNVAGSGGYWVTCGSNRIVADPATITASIGVYTGHINTDKLWSDKLGVTFGRIDRGANANIWGDLESWTDAQRAVIDRELDRIYDEFVERVAASRSMSKEDVDAIGRGRVFTGAQALERGLVDVLGGFDEALDEARKLAGLEPGAKVRLVNFPKVKPLWQQLLEQQSNEEAAVRQVREMWESGVVQTPGVLWMPPIYVR